MALPKHNEEASEKLTGKSAPFSQNNGADPLVYQLVRVEEDGTVVPASEDEVIEMESYLEEGAPLQATDIDGLHISNQVPTMCESKCDVSPRKTSVESQNLDALEAERKRLLAQMAFLDALLQKLKDEERERASLEAANNAFANSKLTRSRYATYTKQGTSPCTHLDGRLDSNSDTNIMVSNLSDDICEKGAVLAQKNNKLKVELESPSSTSKYNWTSTSNESLLREHPIEIGVIDDKRETSRDSDGDLFRRNSNLDNLTIRQLQETFQTTFGRQTSVKDKQWLKRRISLGLGGSVEVTSSEGILDESPFSDGSPGLVKPGTSLSPEQAMCPSTLKRLVDRRSLEATYSLALDSGSLDNHKSLDHRQQSPWVSRQLNVTGDSESYERKDEAWQCREEGKRKRKPTKRYIEELTGFETKDILAKSACLKDERRESNIVKNLQYKEAGRRSKLGVSNFNFRTGYRKRRGRPSKIGSKCLNANSSEKAAKLVRKAISLRTSRLCGPSVFSEPQVKIKLLPNDQLDVSVDPPVPHLNHDGEFVRNLSELKSLEGGAHTASDTKTGSQKKHHHPWTLREVIKLLEGVTHCGVGKWSDIKKFSFSACVYRSSTDLKDKWRNLVRASNTHYKMLSQGGGHWKHSASPVPGPILLRVHELSTQRGEAFTWNAARTGVSRSGRTVLKKQLT